MYINAQIKPWVIAAMLSAGGSFMLAASADQTMDSDVSDSVITTKVKAKLAEKHLSTLTNIQVDTDRQGIVWLSGHAPTQDAIDLAVMIAKGTEGVIRVHNKISVQQ
jgi:hyperosmotically inducible protein